MLDGIKAKRVDETLVSREFRRRGMRGAVSVVSSSTTVGSKFRDRRFGDTTIK